MRKRNGAIERGVNDYYADLHEVYLDKEYHSIKCPDGSPLFGLVFSPKVAASLVALLNNMVIIRDNPDVDPRHIAKAILEDLDSIKPQIS
jgi:hypothetical protein